MIKSLAHKRKQKLSKNVSPQNALTGTNSAQNSVLASFSRLEKITTTLGSDRSNLTPGGNANLPNSHRGDVGFTNSGGKGLKIRTPYVKSKTPVPATDDTGGSSTISPSRVASGGTHLLVNPFANSVKKRNINFRRGAESALYLKEKSPTCSVEEESSASGQ